MAFVILIFCGLIALLFIKDLGLKHRAPVEDKSQQEKLEIFEKTLIECRLAVEENRKLLEETICFMEEEKKLRSQIDRL